MRIEIKKCKNCNEFFSKGRSDKEFCHDNCRYQYHNKNNSRKYRSNLNLENKETILSDIDSFMAKIRVNLDEVKRQFKGVDINSSDNFEVQLEMLEHYDCLSLLRRIKDIFNRI